MKRKFKYTYWELIVRLFKMAAPVRKPLTIATVCSIVGNLSQLALMGFGAMLILSFAGITSGSSPAVYGTFMAISCVLIAVCRYGEGVASHTGAYKLLALMRIDFFKKLRVLAPACLTGRNKGDILNIAVSDIETLEFFFAHILGGPIFTVILLPVVTLCIAWHFNPFFALVLLPVYLIISILIPLISMKAGRNVGMRYRTELAKVKTLVLESVYGIKDIQIFGCGQDKIQQVDAQNKQVNRAAHGLTMHRQAVAAAPTFFVYLARILVILAASYLAAHGTPNPVGTVVVSFIATASFSSTFSLTQIVSSLLETFAAAERLFAIEDTQPEITEPDSPRKLGKIRRIEFHRVGFSYQKEYGRVLSNFNLEIGEHDRIGIVGESGIGKSTVFRLLLRFWDPSEGEIRINGIPIKQASLSELYDRIAVLEQDTFLFDGSIAENIALGKPDATMEEIQTAAKRAGLHNFIQSLPDGYQTQMGKMSARLSGGERQRVGIARVMLADPDVVVMDEPTSALDVLHEKELLKTLHEVYADKILLIISHRSSTLTGCNRMIRIENGTVLEEE